MKIDGIIFLGRLKMTTIIAYITIHTRLLTKLLGADIVHI